MTDPVLSAERRIRDAWLTGVVHALASSLLLVTTGTNIGLAAHYPLLSALAILLLALGIRCRSRTAALLLTVAAVTPAVIKLALGVLQPVDLPAFPLALLYGRGFAGTLQHHRLRRGRGAGLGRSAAPR